jgi:hypothetical protein
MKLKVIAAEILLTAMDFAAATIKRLKEALHKLTNIGIRKNQNDS